ncbi:MAG: PHP domain-containing protein, partial [Lentisphaeraceae bacterium]|nr:PHP domain-containing protein [Lentisphaeraceae bacterium]
AAAQELDLPFVAGVEISVRWKNFELHIVGLNIDPEAELLKRGLANQQQKRQDRIHQIIQNMEDDGLAGAREQILEWAEGKSPGRPLAARYLCENGHCANFGEAFVHLSRGGKYFCEPQWEYMQYAVNWIRQAGGVAVLAHPDKYDMSKATFRGFFREFKQAGGQGIEVCYGDGSKSAMSKCAQYARTYELYASTGSDFHQPCIGVELGRIKPLPGYLKPVWELF